MTAPFNDRLTSLAPAAGETALGFDFPLTTIEDLKITRERGGVTTALVYGADYILPAGAASASATLLAPSQAGDIYHVFGSSPERRLSDFVPSQAFASSKQNADLDYLTKVAQEHRREIDRAWKAPFNTGVGGLIKPGTGRLAQYDAVGTITPLLEFTAAEFLADVAEVAANTALTRGYRDDALAARNTVIRLIDAAMPGQVQEFIVGGDVQSVFLGAGVTKEMVSLVTLGGVSQPRSTFAVANGIMTPVGGSWPVATMQVTTTSATQLAIAAAIPLNNSVTTAKMVDRSVTRPKLALQAVGADELGGAAVTMPALAPDTGFAGVADAQLARASLPVVSQGATLAASDMVWTLTRGSSGSPDARRAPMVGARKISAITTQGVNPTAAFFHDKRGTGPNTSAVALLAESVDYIGNPGGPGGNNPFNEGARLIGLVAAPWGSGYGAIGVGAAQPGVPFQYLCGFEGDVINHYAHAPDYVNFNKNGFTSAFMATSGFGTFRADAGFVTNPFNGAATFSAGVLIAEDSVHTGGVAFASRATTAVGLDLAVGQTTFAAIRINNNKPIKARLQDNSGDVDLIYLDTSNRVVLGGANGQGLFANLDGSGPLQISLGGNGSGGSGYRMMRVADA